MKNKTALVVGFIGIVGSNLASHLAKQSEWTVYGLARRATASEGILPLTADLLT
jgi:GDP-D-mannose dehydratase